MQKGAGLVSKLALLEREGIVSGTRLIFPTRENVPQRPLGSNGLQSACTGSAPSFQLGLLFMECKRQKQGRRPLRLLTYDRRRTGANASGGGKKSLTGALGAKDHYP